MGKYKTLLSGHLHFFFFNLKRNWKDYKIKDQKTKQYRYPVVDVSGGENKLQCHKEQCCIGTWNVRSMNQDKFEVVKQMARVNTDILGISKLRWMGMGEFN